VQGLGVELSSADQRNIADTAWQYCLGSAPDSPTPRFSLTSELSRFLTLPSVPNA